MRVESGLSTALITGRECYIAIPHLALNTPILLVRPAFVILTGGSILRYVENCTSAFSAKRVARVEPHGRRSMELHFAIVCFFLDGNCSENLLSVDVFILRINLMGLISKDSFPVPTCCCHLKLMRINLTHKLKRFSVSAIVLN